MKLKSFRIKNFRSIEDTKCNVSDVLTIFAGKNESGKTTILDALMFLNEDIEFKDGDKPLTGSSEDTSITYVFNLNENEIEIILKRIGSPRLPPIIGWTSRISDLSKPIIIAGIATIIPAIGPAAPISNSARLFFIGVRIFITAPNVPIKNGGGAGRKYGKVASTLCFLHMK
ncbi:AAA family ATPase [candidate division KSB1 bacterium]|nr:AAA family ATPase [candidate division KSB1 bacterium]